MRRDASKVEGSIHSRPMYWAILRARGSYSSAVAVRSRGSSTRSRGASGRCLRVE